MDAPSLKGVLFPWHEDKPILLHLPDSKMLYMPCFSDEDLLFQTMESGGVVWDDVRMFQETEAFVAHVHETNPAVKVILDLRHTNDGIDFTEVCRVIH